MIKRREFLKGAAALSSLMILPSCATSKVKRANSKLQVAIVGAGGRGRAAVDSIAASSDARLVAFCDVDDARAADTYKKYPDIPRFRDYRVMLDKMDKDIDAVAVCTPDHMHYPICAWAIAKGKHVYCEKPLTRTVWEARELQRLADEAGVFTQMGNQGHTNDGWRLIREWSDAGLLGEIEDIYCWTNRPIWPQGGLKVPPGEPVPATLDYNLWLGVAPYQPYNKAILPFTWRGLRNYGTGAAGDMACHFLDVPYSGLELGYPTKVKANSTPFSNYDWPKAASAEMEFANKRGKGGKIRLHWFDGGRRPKEVKRVDEAFLTDKRNDNCTFIVGTKQTVYTNEYGQGTTIYPRNIMRDLAKGGKLPAKTIARSTKPSNPHQEWAKACVEGKNPMGNFNYAAPFTEMVLLNMVAVLNPNKELEYDPINMKFPKNPEADKYLRSLYAYKEEFLPSKPSWWW